MDCNPWNSPDQNTGLDSLSLLQEILPTQGSKAGLPHCGREAKGKGEKERYTHLNAEFQRIARRDKKDFLSDHGKQIEENNRMRKTGDLFKKIRDPKGMFHARWAQ